MIIGGINVWGYTLLNTWLDSYKNLGLWLAWQILSRHVNAVRPKKYNKMAKGCIIFHQVDTVHLTCFPVRLGCHGRWISRLDGV